MTGMQRRGSTPAGPPWPTDLLADLHAGVLEEAEAARLWPLVRADPEAGAVLDALDATVADLAALPRQPLAPMPERFAARLDAAIAAESAARGSATATATAPTPPPDRPAAVPAGQPLARVADLAAARRRRARRLGWAGGVIAAAAAVAAVIVVVVAPKSGTGGQAVAVAPPPASTSSLNSGQLNAAAALANLGRSDYGTLTDPDKLAACLSANGADPNQRPAGGAQITLDGKPGVLLVLTTGQTGRFRLLVVGPDCAAGNPSTLADTEVGGVPRATPTR
ncbi:MAG TPA: hypothetical protein VG756_09415 [Pseudonocardiaceae bacterium]|nr:hypothetical protein [Pseudonocardiaceae bacterium]